MYTVVAIIYLSLSLECKLIIFICSCSLKIHSVFFIINMFSSVSRNSNLFTRNFFFQETIYCQLFLLQVGIEDTVKVIKNNNQEVVLNQTSKYYWFYKSSFIYSFYFGGFWAIGCQAQGLFSALCSGATSGSEWGSAGIQPESASYKASVLSSVLCLWPFYWGVQSKLSFVLLLVLQTLQISNPISM